MTDRHQNPQEPLQGEIARHELWLREHLTDPPTPNVESIKQHVRVAIKERWLEQSLQDDYPAALSQRIKAATRASLSEAPTTTIRTAGRPFGRRFRNALAGWGLAAAACLAIYIAVGKTPEDARDAWSDASHYDPLCDYTKDDILVSLADLSDGFRDVEASLDEYAETDAVDDMLDDLMFEMDRVLTDDDWSS